WDPELAIAFGLQDESAGENADNYEEQCFKDERGREPRRRPVDLGVALIMKCPSGPQPAGGKQAGDDAVTVTMLPDQQCDNREADRHTCELRRPDRKVVQLEQSVVGPRREQQKTVKPVRPPLGHQTRSAAAL